MNIHYFIRIIFVLPLFVFSSFLYGFSGGDFCTPNYYEDDFFQECRPFWLDSSQENQINSAEIFCQNFHDAMPDERILDLNDFKHIESVNSAVASYQDNRDLTWFVRFSEAELEKYIISGLYRLILGKYVPNEQLIRDGDSIIMGSELLEGFTSLGKFWHSHYSKTEEDRISNKYDFQNEIKECLRDNYCADSSLKNVSLTLSAMFLLGENDGHGENVGVICDKQKTSCSLAKIDHFSTSLLGVKKDDVAKRKLNELASLITLRSSCQDRYDLVFRNAHDLGYAMEIIYSIPDDFWKKVVSERINTYLRETGAAFSDDEIEEIIGKYMQIKKSAKKFAEILYFEGAILSNDVEMIKKLESLEIVELKEKYSYINSGKHSGDITPIQMATLSKSQKVVEYLYPLSNDQAIKSAEAEAITSGNYEAFRFFSEKDPDILDSLDYYILSIRHNSNKVFKIFLNESNIDLNDLPDLIHLILESNNEVAYEQLSKKNEYTSDDHISTIRILSEKKELPYFFCDSRILGEILKDLRKAEVNDIKKAIEMLSEKEIGAECLLFDYEEELEPLMKKLGGDKPFIKLALSSNNAYAFKKVVENFTSTESYGQALNLLLSERSPLWLKDGNAYNFWLKELLSLVKSSYIDKDPAKEVFLTLIKREYYATAGEILNSGKIDPDMLLEEKFSNIPIWFFYELYSFITATGSGKGQKTACHEDIKIEGVTYTGKEITGFYCDRNGKMKLENSPAFWIRAGESLNLSTLFDFCVGDDLHSAYDELITFRLVDHDRIEIEIAGYNVEITYEEGKLKTFRCHNPGLIQRILNYFRPSN